MIFTSAYLQLLSANLVRHGPIAIIFLHDLAVFDNLFESLDDTLIYKNFLADHGIILVVGVVRVAQHAIGFEFELKKFVSELSLVSGIIAQVEFICRHGKYRVGVLALQTIRRMERKVSHMDNFMPFVKSHCMGNNAAGQQRPLAANT